MDILKRKILQIEEEEARLIDEAPIGSQVPPTPDSATPDSPIFDKIRSQCVTFTNFTEPQLLDLWRILDPKVTISRGRGPKAAINSLDSLIIFVIFLKTNLHVRELAAFLNLKETTTRDTINRIRRPLNEALEERWS